MNDFFPEDSKKIKERISRYKRTLKGRDRDGGGKRYLVGPMYQLLGDNDAALEYYKWFEETYNGDSGEPYMTLCWALALHRGGRSEAAKTKLRAVMFENLFLIPLLLGEILQKPDIWLGCNWEWQEYAEEIPRELLRLWSEHDKKWAKDLYHSPEFVDMRTRYIEIKRKLKGLKPGPERSALVMESQSLRYRNQSGASHLRLVET